MKQTFVVGPPEMPFAGMNDTFRRQQMPPNMHRVLRNIRLFGEGLQRRKGMLQLHACSRSSDALRSDGSAAAIGSIPMTDVADITEYQFGTKFTVFVAYTVQDLSDDCMVISHSDTAPPWRITHGTDGKITATVNDGTTTATLVSGAIGTEVNVQYQVQLVRDGSDTTLIVNGTDADTDDTLSATASTLTSANDIYLASWSGRATGSQMTYNEVRLHREAITDSEWRVTQYPVTGRFGDPRLVLHLLFEEGTGTTLTDYSRVNNESITIAGNWSWLGASGRQVVTVITGMHVMTNALGRTWLLVDAGKNHYRIPWN